jgi:NAD(P)-dependent dehydrogenase (short-subunit alcohol dehydrogenase family)
MMEKAAAAKITTLIFVFSNVYSWLVDICRTNKKNDLNFTKNLLEIYAKMTNQKVAIITGGSSGIGRATAVALAKEGVNVAIAARRTKEGEETVQLVKEAGSDGVFVQTDVANEDDVKALVEKTVKKYDRLDYAFNNAGIGETMTPLVEQTSNAFDQIMNVNVKGVWLSMKYEIPQMIRTGGGAIVNMSSGAGVIGFPQMPIYIASKHAVLGLTKSAALEYAKSGIRINAVAPGGVETDMLKQAAEDNKQFVETLRSMHPIGRIADPEEIANAVVWLLSDKASFVLGHTLIVDGGFISR